MTKIHNFLKLKSSEKMILIKALFLLWIVRIMLSILPFKVIKQIIKKFTVIPNNNAPKYPIEKLTWSINVMSSYTPKVTCLNQALAAKILLSQYHYPSDVKVGVSKDEGKFEAHAWLESDNKLILGRSEKIYIPILNMGEKTQ
jgi:hypothetical protein